MKLYFSPGACSLSPHIVLREAGFTFDLEKVNLTTKQTASGADFRMINPKGYVPALQLNTGQVLTEGPAIIQYLADQAPEAQLAPSAGTMERYRLAEWLNFISTEIHKGFGLLFNMKLSDETKQIVRDTLISRIEIVARPLHDFPYLTGSQFTVADAYLFTVLNWGHYVNLDLKRWSSLLPYLDRISARPAVRAALVAEGLIKA